MPHQCTTCGRTFPDGSKEMLSGCPDCGGNKFQFKPTGASNDERSTPSDQAQPRSSDRPPASEQTPDSEQSPDSQQPRTSTNTPATESPHSDPTSDDTTPSDSSETDRESDTERVRNKTSEDTAQASARSDVVSPEELDKASRDIDHPDSDAPEAPRPDIGELRDELNEQFESIRIVSPGKYELNLMELYDRQEYIISLQEDGRYVIEMPDAWGISDE